MKVVHSAATPRWTFLLDADGICRAVVPTPSPGGGPVFRALTREVHDMVGAQFLGAVDASVPGGVAAQPRVGSPMLFAFVDPDGRIRLLRTGPLAAFESVGREPAQEDRDPESSGPRSTVRAIVGHARSLHPVVRGASA
jgi:hypothetical protein